MENLDKAAIKDVKMLLSYDDDEIGSCMTTNYICIPKGLSVRQAMSELVRQAGTNDNISTIYVLDESLKFAGAIDLKDLIIARKHDALDDIIVRSYPSVTDHEKIDDCMEKIMDYSEDSIPVLSQDGHMLGVITSEDIVEMVDNEMGEDYAKLAGLTAEEDLKETTVQSMKKRLPWLIILLFLGMIVSFRHIRAKPSGMFQRDRKILKITVIDPDDSRVDLHRPFHLCLIMGLNQHIKFKFSCQLIKIMHLCIIENRCNQKYRICTDHFCLIKLILTDHEIFPQNRKAGFCPDFF